MGEFLTLEEIKMYLKIDDNYEDNLITFLATSAIAYIIAYVGKEYKDINENYKLLYKHCVLMLILTSYENRGALNENNTDKKVVQTSPIIDTMLYNIALKG